MQGQDRPGKQKVDIQRQKFNPIKNTDIRAVQIILSSGRPEQSKYYTRKIINYCLSMHTIKSEHYLVNQDSSLDSTIESFIYQ